MVRQGLKQDARRRVTEALSAQRKERLEQERRLADLAVQILAVIAERDEAVHARVCAEAERWIASRGWRVLGTTRSPITGPEGNVEFLLGAVKEAERGDAID